MARGRFKRKESQMSAERVAPREGQSVRPHKPKSNRFGSSTTTTHSPRPATLRGRAASSTVNARSGIGTSRRVMFSGWAKPFTATTPAQVKSVRLQVEVTPELAAIVEGLAEESNVDADTIVQRAIMLIGMASGAARDGLKVGMARQDQELLTEITGL